MNTAPILVIGSTGKTGSRIVRSLTEKGFPVREGSRNSPPSRSTGTTARNMGVRRFEGVKAAYVSYFPISPFRAPPRRSRR
jgi:uncharacterized protein YbjT (DUF2867 family)